MNSSPRPAAGDGQSALVATAAKTTMRLSYTIEELAQCWHVSRKTVEREIRRGELDAFQVGTTWRIKVEAVQDYEQKKKLDSMGLHRTL